MMAFAYTLIVLLVITSALLTLLILLHRGKGGGLSSMFGGGVSSSLAGSSVAEKNLDRYTRSGGHRLVCLHRRPGPVAEACSDPGWPEQHFRSKLMRAACDHGPRAGVCHTSCTRADPRTTGARNVATGNAIRGTRWIRTHAVVRTGRSGPASVRDVLVRQWARDRRPRSQPTSCRRPCGTARVVGFPAVRTRKIPRPPRAEPYKTSSGICEGTSERGRRGRDPRRGSVARSAAPRPLERC